MKNVFKINSHNTKWKILYFVFQAATFVRYFYFAYYESRGLSRFEGSMVEASFLASSFIFCLVSSYIADRLRLHNILLVACFSIFGAANLLLALIPKVSNQNEANVYSNITNTTISESIDETVESAYSKNFWFIFSIRMVSSVGFAPAESLLNGCCYFMLEKHSNISHSGKQRLWGSIGFSTFCFLATVLMLYTGMEYEVVFYVCVSFCALFCITSFFTMRKLSYVVGHGDNSAKPGTTVSLALLKKYVCDWNLWYLVSVAFAGAIFTAFRDTYVLSYLKSVGGTFLQFGMMQLLIGYLEVPNFFICGYVIKKVGSFVMFSVVFAAFSLRFFLFTLLTESNAWTYPLMELLHIPCFAYFYTTMTRFLHLQLPAELTATAQGVVSAVFFGVGQIAGTVIAGLFDDPRRFYANSAMASGIFCVVITILGCFMRGEADEREHDAEVPADHKNEALVAGGSSTSDTNGEVSSVLLKGDHREVFVSVGDFFRTRKPRERTNTTIDGIDDNSRLREETVSIMGSRREDLARSHNVLYPSIILFGNGTPG